MDLLDLVNRYQSKLQQNPKLETGVRVNQFLAQVQAQGQDLSRWSEDEWWVALRELGVPEDEIIDQIQNVASWSVVDNTTWK